VRDAAVWGIAAGAVEGGAGLGTGAGAARAVTTAVAALVLETRSV
jgi:hypothetical protein